jgi:integrase
MPRQVKDATLGTRNARSKLKAGGKPHYREIGPGLHLGYRKLKTGGKWTVRVYAGDGKYLTKTIAVADDHDEADGKRVLDYGQAQQLARRRSAEILAADEGGHVGPYNVKAAFDDYLAMLAHENRDTRDTRGRIGHIVEALGNIELQKLKKKHIEDWLKAIPKTPPVSRNGQPLPVDMTDPEVQRRRKDTANRNLTTLKAALNYAYNEGKVASDKPWRTVKPFRGVGSARIRYLSMDEVTRLLNACPPDLRALVNGALLTGARLSDLTGMVVGDYLPDSEAVMVGNRKGHHAGKPAFACYLSPEGVTFFESHTAGIGNEQRMFTRDDGRPWTRHDVNRPLRAANTIAKIDPPATFHVLRHTYASHAVMAGVPLMVVAQNLGHSDTRMCEKHYSHLAPSYARDAIAKGLPKWGIDSANVQPIRANQKK